ncbi:TPA: UDP-glucose/GDP-mannose dehydrogenase family protein, partial [Candidatus Bathyarchaeota archaeon]|nr:UDP-glucose/GDP-mannose dehydrogenase family protein [Candidatus Bathyarchaeota archaeon]
MDKARISIIGAGYVGLVTAVCLASRGHEVIVSTHSSKKAGLISRGIAPFYEKGLDPLLRDAVRSGGLRVVIGRERAVLGSDVSFITVATPSKPDGSIDLRFIEATSRDIGLALAKKPGYHLVVVKSTVIPGTTQDVVGPLVESASGKRAGPDFGLCMNPEFLKEGAAVHDTLHPDRIVIGELDRRSGDLLESLYREFYGDDVPPVMRTNIPTAEMIKYVNNSFLAMKVSFINQIANICERVPGVDVKDVARGIGLDYRINPRFLRAGPGFGGSCFPKDVSALISFAESKGYEPSLLREVLSVNARQARHVVDLLM